MYSSIRGKLDDSVTILFTPKLLNLLIQGRGCCYFCSNVLRWHSTTQMWMPSESWRCLDKCRVSEGIKRSDLHLRYLEQFAGRWFWHLFAFHGLWGGWDPALQHRGCGVDPAAVGSKKLFPRKRPKLMSFFYRKYS